MKVNVKGHIRDLLAFRGLVAHRRKRIAQASARRLGPDPINQLAQRLHPELQKLVVAKVIDQTKTTRTFRLVLEPESEPRELAYFRAGQYLSLKPDVDGVRITRPYSVASAPHESLGDDGYYDITVRRESNGFLTAHMWDTWAVGTKIQSSGPCGTFYHEPLRDEHQIVGLAGGSGITPFRSMAREIIYGGMDASLLVLYGSSDEDDIVFYEEFKELESRAPDRFRIVHVLSCEDVSLEGCEQGFITAGTIGKYADVRNSSFFICGPRVMYRFVEQELATFNLPRRRIRKEVYGAPRDVTESSGFPTELADQVFRLQVHIGGALVEIPAKAVEPLLVAMERANLAPPSECRSGECGFCRSRLVAGEVYINPDTDGRRAADKRFGYIHPCASYPLTDLEVFVPRSK